MSMCCWVMSPFYAVFCTHICSLLSVFTIVMLHFQNIEKWVEMWAIWQHVWSRCLWGWVVFLFIRFMSIDPDFYSGRKILSIEIHLAWAYLPLGHLSHAPTPFGPSAENPKYSQLKISHTAVVGLAARVAKLGRQRDSEGRPFPTCPPPSFALGVQASQAAKWKLNSLTRTRSNWQR